MLINKKIYKILILFLMIAFNACKEKINNSKSIKDVNGNYYQLLGIGDGLKKPNLNSILLLNADVKTQRDSLFFNTNHSTKNGLQINLSNPIIRNKFSAYFLNLVEGDSALLSITPVQFFRSFFDTIVPNFCKNDSLIHINFKITAILTQNDYKSLQLKEIEDKELLELKVIDGYLKQNYPTVKPNYYGIYELEKIATNNAKPQPGNKITISYQGFFIDGNPLDAKPQQIEYIYGTPDQFIKGLNIVIGTLKKGEFSKIIVPSRLAFGEIGNSNQLVQPYTPLVYNLKLIDIK